MNTTQLGIFFFRAASLVFFYIVLICLGLVSLSGCHTSQSGSPEEEGFIPIFDGKTLDDWEFDSVYWRVENGVLVGEVTPETLLKRNSFIIRKNLVTRDFELKVEYRVSARGNSGINYRSEKIDTLQYALKGYQCDIDGQDNWSGQNYEERGREFLALRGQTNTLQPGYVRLTHSSIREVMQTPDARRDSLQQLIKKEDWNEIHLVVKGNRMQHYINGALMSDVTDNDLEHRKMEGLLGVQVHVGPPMKIEYRNFLYKKAGTSSTL